MNIGGLIDTYGRTAVDLRVSLTDTCNLRCTYCMPAEGLDWLPKADVLTDDEVVRLIRIAVERLGIEDHQLLLDPERVAGAGEVRLHVASEGSQL